MVATGALANGDIVGLRSDGTVEKAAGTAATIYTTSVGTPVVFESASTQYFSATFDSNSNKVVITYVDGGNSYYGTAVVGTVSGDTISFGTPVVFNSASTSRVSPTFDSNSNKVVIAYSGTAVVGTVSGDTISFGTPVVFASGSTWPSAIFDSNSKKVVIAYYKGSGAAIVGTVSGNSITFGSPVTFSNSTSLEFVSATFDSHTNKAVIAYKDYNYAGYGTAVVGTVSGDTISFGTPAIFESGSVEKVSATFDSNSKKVVIAYVDVDNQYYGTVVLGTIGGNSISFGTPVLFRENRTNHVSATFDSHTNKVVIAYRQDVNPYSGTAIAGTVSGDSIIFDPPLVFAGFTITSSSLTFDSNSNKVVILYGGYSAYGNAAVFQTKGFVDNTNADNWMGIADGTSGTVKIIGGVAEGLTGLTVGATYYVNYDGTLTTTESAGLPNGTYGKIGKALTSTKLLITNSN